MNENLDDRLAAGLDTLEHEGRLRVPKILSDSPRARTVVDGRPVVNFASNNYLDLAGHPAVVEAARAAAADWGAGATASRLLGGSLAVHRELEEALARHKNTAAALVFPSGYHANLGAIPALVGPGDSVFLDRLAHASLVDGARLSKARLRVFAHNDPEDLDQALARAEGEKWVITESVFSMDGDRAPLKAIAEVCRKRGARLYVDEAHGTGVWGPGGRGWVNALDLEKRVDVCMGTLSKALGAQGGFIAGSDVLVRWVQNRARAFIYSTALSPGAAAAAREALRIAVAEPERRARAFDLSARLRQGLGVEGEGPIVPLLVGEDHDALALAAALWEQGLFAPAVRPPTVPAGTARIRFSVTAGHTEADIDRALAVVENWRAASLP